MKKIALSLAVIAASGAVAFKEVASHFIAQVPNGPAFPAGLAGLGVPPASGSQPVADTIVAGAASVPPPSAIDPPLVTLSVRPSPLPRGRPDRDAGPATVPRPIPGVDATPPNATTVAVVTPPSPNLAPPAPPAPGAVVPANAAFRDGSYTGNRYDAYWGVVQVRAVVKDGRLSSVDVLTYPSDRRTSQQINRYALPLLQREVVQAQGASVNIISGATLTTVAYLSSLRTALQQAH